VAAAERGRGRVRLPRPAHGDDYSSVRNPCRTPREFAMFRSTGVDSGPEAIVSASMQAWRIVQLPRAPKVRSGDAGDFDGDREG
jgi:hypothetical protein